ncbi:hypothetical protein, partial [Ralstonia pseudosolanacearum]|uniref:hypothetical protein n=1 Tax=Ralstonia pseudosolanacearum TaxID=1310165 RepID=UPI001E3AF8C1
AKVENLRSQPGCLQRYLSGPLHVNVSSPRGAAGLCNNAPVKRQCGFRCAHHQYVRALRQDEIGNQALDRRFRKKYRVAANATHAGNPMSESGLKKTAESAWNHCCPLQLSAGCGTILYALCAVCIAGALLHKPAAPRGELTFTCNGPDR